jgi:cation/acetate symporter
MAANAGASAHNGATLHVDHWKVTAVFAVCVAAALVIAKLATLKTRLAADVYDALGAMRGGRSGLAVTGSYLSGASLLGLSAMIMTDVRTGLMCLVGFLAGWPLMVFLMAERLRNLGKFTLADVMTYRFHHASVRVFAALSTLTVTVLYLAAQMVGVGQLIRLLFGLEYWMAVTITGALMMFYVRLGGMIATTWLEMVKTVLLLVAALLMVFMVLLKSGLNGENLFAGALEAGNLALTQKSASGMAASLLPSDPISFISLALALTFGVIGLPHVLMRFFIAQDAREARRSASWATLWNACFYLLSIPIIFGAARFVGHVPAFLDAGGGLTGGENMAVIHLAYAVSGEVLMGFISAVAFMTLLAAVAALVLAGAAAASHDLYAIVFRKGKTEAASELRVAHLAVLCLGLTAVLLGIACEDLNIAVMVSLAFAIAASAHFPVLFLSIFWKNCTTRGAVISGIVGLLSALILSVLSGPLWVDVLHHERALFPYASPALFSMSAAFFCAWFFSITDRSERAKKERAAFLAQQIRAETGLGGVTHG